MGNICMVVNIKSKFKGEIIRLFELLEEKINENADNIIYMFPVSADNDGFMKDFKQHHKVYFISDNPYKKICKGIVLNNKTDEEEIKKIILKEEIKIIHSHYDQYDKILCKISRFLNVPIVVHVHCCPIYLNKLEKSKAIMFLKNEYYKYVMNFLLSNAIKIAVGQDLFIKLKKLGVKKIKLIENGIDKSYIGKKDDNKFICNRFIFIGTRLEKGVKQMLEAIDILNSMKKEFIVNFIVSNMTNEYVKEYYNRKEMQVPSNINIIEEGDVIVKTLKNSDCGISASKYETFSFAIAEYLYYGIPCISNDIEGVMWAENSSNVMFFKNNDSKDLANKMLVFLKEGANKLLCCNAQSFIEENYTSSIWINKIIALYKSLAKNL